MKLGTDDDPSQELLFFGQIHPGADPARGQNRSWGPLLQRTSSDWKVTATNRMHSNDLQASGKKCCFFLFYSEVKFLTRFNVFFELVIFVYINAVPIDLYAVKFFICINYV